MQFSTIALKKAAILVFLILFPFCATNSSPATVTDSPCYQILKPSKWTAELSSTNVTVGDEVELILKATIDEGWYVYSVGFDPDCGPLPVTIKVDNEKNFKLLGAPRAVHDKTKYDKVFECEVKIFQGTAEIHQKIKILSSNPDLKIIYDGQVCTEKEGKCVSFDGEVEFHLTIAPATIKKTEDPKKNETSLNTPTQKNAVDSSGLAAKTTVATSIKTKGPVLDKSILDGEAEGAEQSLIAYVFFAFLLGLASLITPCVFPMIPMTITFFLKDNQTKEEGIRKAITFGVSIILIYTVVGTLFAFLLGPEGLNALATHWLPNLLISFIFILFALSFLGLFEINAPHKLVNKTDRGVEKGGLVGIFFMSATLVLVSFSCTLPLVGNVLVMSAGGQFIKPVVGMLAYSLAYALPFAIFAFFPEWLKSLPKSGGWLNTVKVTLGLFELALAFKFFSIADLSYQWGILDRDINIAIWIVIFTVLGFYLLGKIRLPNDTPVEKVTIARLMLSIATFTFVVYLIPGLWGAPLKALAGYLPPMYTHDFDLNHKDQVDQTCDEPKHADILHLPHGLHGYFDYEQAIACARQQKKPLFIDFTGHGCTNCREMEAAVWSDEKVLNSLKNDFVIVALYVDDKTELPESEWYKAKDGKMKKTIGKKNADLQISNLDNNAQPFYVLVGADERVLAWPYDYDRNVEKFVAFLEKGKKKYKELYVQ